MVDTTDSYLCGTVEYVTGESVFVVDCADIMGSKVMITQEDTILTLCEVQVFGKSVKNIATSTQFSLLAHESMQK